MSERGGGSVKKGEGKKAHKNKPTSKKYEMYTISGDNVKKSKECVKCGPGIFLAQHKDRSTCGKCGYTEFSKK
ncbi:MAG: 30S ribosomal protein S27ae [Nanoarchaeota archaeon]